MKIFYGYELVPPEWLGVDNEMGDLNWDKYAPVCIVTRTKDDAVQYICRYGYDVRRARRLVDGTRKWASGDDDPITTLIDAGAVRVDRPGVYTWTNTGDGELVRRALYGRNTLTVAQFVRDGDDLSADALIRTERVTEDSLDGRVRVYHDGVHIGDVQPGLSTLGNHVGWHIVPVAAIGRTNKWGLPWAETEDDAVDRLATGDYKI